MTILHKPSEALLLLAEKIANKETSKRGPSARIGNYICYDLQDMALDGLIAEAASRRIRDHIAALLHPDTALLSWIAKNHMEVYPEMNSAKTNGSDEWFSYKLAWVLDMASYFQERGE